MGSGYIRGTTNNQYIIASLDWTCTPDVNTNTSSVSVSLYLYKDQPYAYRTWGTGTWYINVAGEASAFNESITLYSDLGWVLIGTKTVTVSHNQDGTRSINISASGGIPSTSYTTTSVSGTITLDTIPRASSLTCGNLTMGQAATATIAAASTGFRHDLYLILGSASQRLIYDKTGGGYSVTAAIATFAPQITAATAASATLRLDTYNSARTAQIGQKSYSITLTVPSSVVPTISSVATSEAVSGIAAKFGAYIQNKSKLAVSITAAGVYGSTISRYETTIGGTVYRDRTFTSNTLTGIGNISVTTRVTDSRGRTTTSTKTVSVLAYSAPQITAIAVSRIDATGAAADDGNRFALRLAYAITSLGSKNDHTIAISYKQTGGSYTAISSGSASWNYDGTIKYTDSPNVSPDYTYTVQVTLTDYFGSTTMTADLRTSNSIMDFLANGTGMAVGKAAEISNLFDVNWAARFRNNVTTDGYLKITREAKAVMFSQTNDEGDRYLATISAYPDKAGIYRVGAPVAGIPTGTNGYGALLIFNAGSYMLHIFIDVSGNFYVARGGSAGDGITPTIPTTWKKCTTTDVAPRT